MGVPYSTQMRFGTLCERGLAIGRTDGDIGYGSGELIIPGLKSPDFIFEVTYSLLQPPHLLNHFRIRTADVAKQSLRHDVGPPH